MRIGFLWEGGNGVFFVHLRSILAWMVFVVYQTSRYEKTGDRWQVRLCFSGVQRIYTVLLLFALHMENHLALLRSIYLFAS